MTKQKCYCPRCEKTHYMRIKWIGSGKAYKYCQQCRYMTGIYRRYPNKDYDNVTPDWDVIQAHDTGLFRYYH